MESITTRHESHAVLTTYNHETGIFSSRLYVNCGATPTTVEAKHKTAGGAARWTNRVLGR